MTKNKIFSQHIKYFFSARPDSAACVHLADRVHDGGAAGGGEARRQDALRLLARAHLPEEVQVQVNMKYLHHA